MVLFRSLVLSAAVVIAAAADSNKQKSGGFLRSLEGKGGKGGSGKGKGGTDKSGSGKCDTRFGCTVWDILNDKADVSTYWRLVQNVFTDPAFDDPNLDALLSNITGDFPYQVIPPPNFVERTHWLEVITTFTPTNRALEAFEPFGEPLRSKILGPEWQDHTLEFLAGLIVKSQDLPIPKTVSPYTGPPLPFGIPVETFVDPTETWFRGSTLNVNNDTCQVSTTTFPDIVANILEKDLNLYNSSGYPGLQVFDYGAFFGFGSFRLPGFANTIDKVLFPDCFATDIIQVLQADAEGRFTIFLTILSSLDLIDDFKTYGECNEGFAAYAPINSAFDNINVDNIPESVLTRIMLNHFVEGDVYPKTSKELGYDRTTLAGDSLYVSENRTAVYEEIDGRIVRTFFSLTGTIGDANFVPDTSTSEAFGQLAVNGIVTYIDAVLIPSEEDDETNEPKSKGGKGGKSAKSSKGAKSGKSCKTAKSVKVQKV